jgi:hypothetical protein
LGEQKATPCVPNPSGTQPLAIIVVRTAESVV